MPTVYLSPSDVIGLTQESNIVLSPHFYWCKKSTIPLHSLAQAKKIAPSLFENDTFEEDLSYEVYQNPQGEMIFLAYDIKQITNRLKEAGLDFKLIKNVYLAQQLCDTMTAPLTVGEEQALALVDSIVVAIHPDYLRGSSQAIDDYLKKQEIKAKKLPVEGIGNFDILHYKKEAIAVLSLFVVALILKFISLGLAHSRLEAKEQSIRQTYKLPATSIQMRSIVSRLSLIDKEQNAIRESLDFISKNRTQIAGRLKQLSVTSKTLDMEFSKPDEALQSLIKKGFTSAKLSLGEDLLIVKVTL